LCRNQSAGPFSTWSLHKDNDNDDKNPNDG
jgi:hypothetical protein